MGKTDSMVVSRKRAPSSRQLGRFAWLLAVIATVWLLIAVTESAPHDLGSVCAYRWLRIGKSLSGYSLVP